MYPVDPTTGIPTYADCGDSYWSNYYFTEGVASAFQNIYSNKYGLADAFGGFWGRAAELFKGNPGVIGFGNALFNSV